MSYSLDANILIYASDRTSPFFERATQFLIDCMNNPDPLYLCWPTVFAYLRISTHPSIFAAPLSPKAATENVNALQVLPHVRFIGEGEQFWERYGDICEGLSVRGNLVSDAHVAALLREKGIRRLFSRNRDFLKFPYLVVIDPFA